MTGPMLLPPVDKSYIRDVLNQSVDWAQNQGSDDSEYLGAGLFYYTLAYRQRPRFCVCLGSGSGFVPRLMRQAQRDLGLVNSKTVLIDPSLGRWGRHAPLDRESLLRTAFPDIEVIVEETADVAVGQGKDWQINYLHIDTDRSREGSGGDFFSYVPLMAPEGVITFHDTQGALLCGETLADIRDAGYDVLNSPWAGGGVALIKQGAICQSDPSKSAARRPPG